MLKPVNESLHNVTLQDILDHKKLSSDQINHDLTKLLEFDATENRNNFYGNPTLYHYQLENLLKCHRDKGKTLFDVWNDEEQRAKLISDTRKRNRGGRTAAGNIFECFRINTGSVVMFKSTTAKYIYQKYGAKKVLDPTAGWGGRMLGAWALGIDYTGIDTNIGMVHSYYEMLTALANYPTIINTSCVKMIWDSCLDVDFSKIKYDFVLTSPPYINMEVYEHMTKWNNDEAFYVEFLLPLWNKCVDNIEEGGGKVCFNISPQMYKDAKYYGLRDCDFVEDLKQQLGQQTGKKKQDLIYGWNC